MSAKKTTGSEDEYFAREEKARKEKANIKKEQEEKEARKELHFMKCPKCGGELASKMFRDVEIDVCGDCSGVWLDPGELESLAGKESHFLSEMFTFFKGD